MRHRAISTKLLLCLMFASLAYVTLLCACSGSKTTDPASSGSGGGSGQDPEVREVVRGVLQARPHPRRSFMSLP